MPGPAKKPAPVRLLPHATGEKASREIDEGTFSRYFAPFFDYKARTGQGSSDIDNLAKYYQLIDAAVRGEIPAPYFYDKKGVARMNNAAVGFDKDGNPIPLKP